VSPRPDPGLPARPAAAPETIGRARAALWRSGDFGVVVLPEQTDDPVTLAGSGALLWELLAQPRTLPDVAEELAGLYGAPVDVVASDLEPVVERLVSIGALERA
jgi:hypothetical protein